MSWKFWKVKEKNAVDVQIEYIRKDISSLDEKVEVTNEQIKRLTRLQFKSAKSMEEEFEEIKSSLQTQKEQANLISQVDEYANKQHHLIQHFIRLLDEMDHISAGLNDGQEAWRQLLEEWSRNLVRSLNEVGIHELDVLGEGFNPTVSEAMETVEIDSLDPTPRVPYQIVEVLKRGFVDDKENLIRKAQVVTVKEL
ncbi:nucleotide exchange factor GrpE [Sporosarcina limicola]|uniref:Molecular chaperone GrpE (Heat shock protein) n=1 Tax=Sporosarcina limicola TaxID=34101 RepID=A0A927MML1_9BACL|nr:nucleotide exchange factor GrpE [Sporosarcina limicola]MBE1556738.1 molecular chaperone GrpE (heat shock protein) [Sporosarcina limicola]